MSNISVAGQESYFNEKATFFNGVEVKGDLVANITGDITGDIKGNVTGNVTGNLTGNVQAESITVGSNISLESNGNITASAYFGDGSNLSGLETPAAFPTGTLMLFQQTEAPTGWTKQTNHNNKALRVVSGTAGSGGSTAFTSAFTSRTPAGTVSGSNSGGSVSAHTLTTAQMPSHTHIPRRFDSGSGPDQNIGNGVQTQNIENVKLATTATGGGGSHNHGFTQPTWSGTFTGTALDFAVQYVDLIIASKN